MGKTYKEQSELAAEITAAESQVIVSATYQHYKGSDKLYTVTSLGFIEATNELCVIYKAQYGERLTFIRPLSVWLESVEWDGQIVPRFSKL